MKKLNNIEEWPDHYDNFKDWLTTKAETVGKNQRIISYSSKNHAIKALNILMTLLYKERLIATEPKCDTFPDHLVGKRTVEDIVSKEEMEKVYSQLKLMGHTNEAIFYRLLFFTGFRFNEGLALSVSDIFGGEVENEFFSKKMERYKIKYFGYLVLQGQFGGFSSNGKVQLLPFKSKRSIEQKEKFQI